MDIGTLMREVDGVAACTLGCGSFAAARVEGGGRREVCERFLRETRAVAGETAARELAAWLTSFIRREARFPHRREVRKAGARLCRSHAAEVPATSSLGA